MYSNCCCSCSIEPEIIKIGQSSHKMYRNNILKFQESTTILDACTKMSGNILNAPCSLSYIYIYIYREREREKERERERERGRREGGRKRERERLLFVFFFLFFYSVSTLLDHLTLN